MQEEWFTLFLIPRETPIMHRMLVHRQPGDPLHKDKLLAIKVLREGNELIGFVTYFVANHTLGIIELLAINQRFRGNGYGKKLIAFVQQEFKAHGIANLNLYCQENNVGALNMYHHLGFKNVARYPHLVLLGKSI
jgi:ribosomal protein S18 acetylase RimI-like enzyme